MDAITDSQQSRRQELKNWWRFLGAESHVLRERPGLLFQQAANQPQVTTPSQTAGRRLLAGSEKRPWLRWINKPQAQDPCLFTFVGHLGSARSCGFSPDGRRVLSASRFGTLKIWDSETGSELVTIAGDEDMISCSYSSSFSVDGTRVVFCQDEGSPGVWDVESGAKLRVLAAPPQGVCYFVTSDLRIVSFSQEDGLELWDGATGKKLGSLGRLRDPYSVTFAASPDGNQMLVSFDWKTTRLNVARGTEVAVLSEIRGMMLAAAFLPDGIRAVVLSWGEQSSDLDSLEVWDLVRDFEVAKLEGFEYSEDMGHG